ncbi:O-methyltransferase [Winogradskyella eximia]|uniref:O-methyltransferase n=1 Tax=Winogradskyella eximia TaxID=262006 RepID=UPI00248FBF32|nr:class I SAM-dependent methyltransferase [Winogradskyella eximia]
MITSQLNQIKTTISELFEDSKYDMLKMMKGAAKSVFRAMQPLDFKDAYLSISKEQGESLIKLITDNKLKNSVEFGTSFGISTLFLAQGVIETGGHIITTELIDSKAKKAIENFERAGVSDLIEVRVGDAMETLKSHDEPIDLLLLDGWKDLYLPLFQMLESNFHSNTFIYVDNAEMSEVKTFLNVIRQNSKYQLQSQFGGKVVLITLKTRYK